MLDILKPQKANINKVIDKLNESLPILRQFRRVQQMMAKRKFYSALKIMGQIEHTHLSQVEQFKFAKNIQNQFPIIKEQIIKTIQVELKDFLENIQVILARYNCRNDAFLGQCTENRDCCPSEIFTEAKARFGWESPSVE